MSRKLKTLIIVIFVFLMSGCYGSCGIAEPVESNQMGIELGDGTIPTNVFPPGRYSNGAFLATLIKIDVGVKTFDWSDTSLVTRDKQPIGLTLSISVARPSDPESLTNMYNQYRAACTDDAALQALVISRVPRVAKGVSSSLSLEELLSRNDAQTQLSEALQKELQEFGVELRDVGISDIQVSPGYQAALEAKANSQAEAEKAKQDALRLEQELLREEVQTQIELEKARRENEVALEKSKVFEVNPYALELEKLRIMADALKPSDKVFFVPEGSNLTMFFTPEGATQQPFLAPSPITSTNVVTP